MASHFIVIAFDCPRTCVNHRHHALHDGRRIGTVANKIPEQCELRSPARMSIRDTDVKRLHVGMNVREKR